MLKNMKLGTRLGTGFSLLILMMGILVFFSTSRIGALNTNINIVVNDRMVKTRQANNVIDLVTQSMMALRDMLLSTDAREIQQDNELITKSSKEISRLIDSLESSIQSEDGRKRLEAMNEARAPLLETLTSVRALALKNNPTDQATASKLLLAELRPRQDAYVKAITDLIDFQTSLADADGTSAGELADSTQQILIVIAIIALILGLLAALLITKSITTPINRCIDIAQNVAKGQTNVDIRVDSQDEIGTLMRAMQSMVEAINNMVSDASLLSKAAIDGKLATRADASKHQGDFRKIVQGVNETLDAVINPLNVAADYVEKISKGVIPPAITANYNGDFNAIKTNLNTLVKMMNDLLRETDILIKAAAEGDLGKRADATLFQGGWNQLVLGVNSTVTNIVDPLMVTADYVDKVSKGIIPPAITDNYLGQYNVIKNNLNAVVGMMTALLKETNSLVSAALGGSLATRAKADLFVGGWNQLVAGVNQTLDAVLEPINEAAGVLDKVAARDMTARVQGNYKGDHAKIKNSLNLAVENLDQALSQVSDATTQVASASQQISAGSQSLAQGANEQASSLEEVSSSLEEMSSMTKMNADNATQAKNLASEADGNAKTGTEAMARMSHSILRIKEGSDQTAKIVKTIDEIAMQTNLLALNAAVEAARAGEAGRGFAVVAEEVRNLAQRSAQAAKNTADMIGESVKNAEEGVKIATDVSKSFDSIALSVKKVNDLIGEIAAASKEQSQGIGQVTTAVSQMDKVTQQNAANAEESASAAEELSSQSEELQSMVGQFHISQSSRAMIRSTAPTPTHTKPKPITKQIASQRIAAHETIPMDDASLKEF